MKQPDNTPYGTYGGAYVPESLMPTLHRIRRAFEEIQSDREFTVRYEHLLERYVGRETPLYSAEGLTASVGGGRIVFKREDLNHTGSHKINNVLGQLLLAKRLGYASVMAETGAGQHGVATATAAALFGMPCTIFMGEKDVERQALNVRRMSLLGARIQPVGSGTRTLKDATNEAIRHWSAHAKDTYYCIGSVVGPSPYPEMVAHFQSVIGRETKRQFLSDYGKHPDAVVACVGGGSNAAGIFQAYLEDDVALYGAEAGGLGLASDRHGAALAEGRLGIIQGMKTKVLQDESGNILPAHSISAGLDYPGVGPLHAMLQKSGRANYVAVRDEQAVQAYRTLARTEGIIPALESAHAVALGMRLAAQSKEGTICVLLSGRGDKDIERVMDHDR